MARIQGFPVGKFLKVTGDSQVKEIKVRSDGKIEAKVLDKPARRNPPRKKRKKTKAKAKKRRASATKKRRATNRKRTSNKKRATNRKRTSGKPRKNAKRRAPAGGWKKWAKKMARARRAA